MSKSLPQTLAQTFGISENEPGSKKLDQKFASNFCANFWAKSLSKSLPQTFWQTFGITNQHPGEQKFAPTFASNFLANVGAMNNTPWRAKACANVCLKLFGKRWRHECARGSQCLSKSLTPNFGSNVGSSKDGVADMKSLSKSLPQTFTQTFTQAFMIPNPVQFGSSPNSKSNQPRPLSTQFHQEQRPN